MNQNAESESRQLIAHHQDLQRAIEMAQGQQNLLRSNIYSIDLSIRSIESISKKICSSCEDKNSDVIETMIPIGFGCFINSKIKNPISKILINVGSNIIIEKNSLEAIEYLKERKQQFEKMILDINNSLNKMKNSLYEIENKINELNSYKK